MGTEETRTAHLDNHPKAARGGDPPAATPPDYHHYTVSSPSNSYVLYQQCLPPAAFLLLSCQRQRYGSKPPILCGIMALTQLNTMHSSAVKFLMEGMCQFSHQMPPWAPSVSLNKQHSYFLIPKFRRLRFPSPGRTSHSIFSLPLVSHPSYFACKPRAKQLPLNSSRLQSAWDTRSRAGGAHAAPDSA